MGTVNVDKLTEFLRGEISAVETYRFALEAVGGREVRSTLQECQRSHEERVGLIRDELIRLGGALSTSWGAWRTWVRAIEGNAKLGGEQAAIAVLEEGEELRLEGYRLEDGDEVDDRVRALVIGKLLPQQQLTRSRLGDRKTLCCRGIWLPGGRKNKPGRHGGPPLPGGRCD